MGQLKIDADFVHPPAMMWRALTEAKPLSEWFQPVAGWPESGARPGSQGRVYPTDDLRGFGSFEMDVVEAEPHSRLVLRWRGDDFTSEVGFEIRPVPGGGCRLLLRQAGFLGTQEIERWETLGLAWRVMLERLGAALDRLALGVGEGAFLRAEVPDPDSSGSKGPDRAHLVAVVCVVIVAGLCGTAGALWMNRDTPPIAAPTDGASSDASLGSGVQPQQPQQPPVASGFPAQSPAVGGTKEKGTTAAEVPPAPPSAKPLVASYQTRALPAGLLGFDTEVTVRNPGDVAARNGWTVVLTMPNSTAVQNQSATVVKVRQEGDVVTVTPVATTLAAGGSVTFTIRFPALLALQTVKGCTIDGKACAAA